MNTMTLIKQHPIQMNSMINDLLNAFPNSLGRDFPVPSSIPPVNIHETNEGFHLELNAPGRNKENFNHGNNHSEKRKKGLYKNFISGVLDI
jgi:HSP20 family molecular chaperone IbpA